MPAFILDASVALSWCLTDEATPFSLGLLRRLTNGEEVIVPAHWPIEVLSALLQGKRRSRIDDTGIERFFHDLASFRVTIEQSPSITGLRDLKTLSDKHILTAYDAAYLELAKRATLPLATFDMALVRACAREQVAVLTSVIS